MPEAVAERIRGTRRGPGRPRATGGIHVIVAAAIDNFQARGYHGTSMRDIARDAGVNPASIYHYFPSKQDILQRLMEEVMKDVISVTNSALLRADNAPRDQLAALMRAWVLFHTERQAEALIVASELRSLDETGRRIVVALRDQQENMFRDIVDRGVADGDFTTDFPREAARAVINMGYSIASWYRRDGDLSPEEMADRYAALALSTVGRRP